MDAKGTVPIVSKILHNELCDFMKRDLSTIDQAVQRFSSSRVIWNVLLITSPYG